jgi:hypothetical protein
MGDAYPEKRVQCVNGAGVVVMSRKDGQCVSKRTCFVSERHRHAVTIVAGVVQELWTWAVVRNVAFVTSMGKTPAYMCFCRGVSGSSLREKERVLTGAWNPRASTAPEYRQILRTLSGFAEQAHEYLVFSHHEIYTRFR